MNRYKNLLGNTIIFAVGNLGSKLISFLLVPFYTFVLTKQEFGTVDLITTTMNMLLPIITLSIFDAVFRFALDRNMDEDEILSNGFFISLTTLIAGAILIPLLIMMNVSHPIYIYLLLFTGAFSSLFLNFSRAIGRIKLFAVAGIIGTLIIAITNIIFLLIMNLKIEGYLLSIILSNIIVTAYLLISTRDFAKIRWNLVNKKLIKKMLLYSMPLIPNSFSWWVNTSADRFFILFFIGASANGIYAVASKIPSVLNILNQIFFQSWQMSAVQEYDSSDAQKFYSDIFNYYQSFQFLIISGFLVILKPLMKIIVSPTYYSSWKYIPFLLLAVLYSSLSGFIGTTYTAAKHTNKILITTMIGSIVNIVLGFILVPVLGLQGASLSGCLSFLLVLVIRLVDSKNIIPITVDTSKVLINHLLVIFMIIILFSKLEIPKILLLNMVMFIISMLVNGRLILNIKNLKRD